MKKRLVAVCLTVVLGVSLWRGGILEEILWRVGRFAALSALSRAPVVGESVRLETGQGYEEGLLVAPPSAESGADEPSVGAPSVDLSINNGKYTVVQNIAIKNGAQKQVNIPELLQDGFEKPAWQADEPVVLIYHTHTTESYADASAEYSDEDDRGVVGVGRAMKEVFESHGLKTVHLTENYIDGGAFKKAYTRSLAGVEAALEKYPSIRIVLDIHRDSITDGSTEYCPLTTIDGEEYAQVMLISGTDALGLSHPDWEKNLRFAVALVAQMQEDYPSLARPLNLNQNRYNTHTTPYALLMEVGGEANTSVQAKRAGCAVAESIVRIVT